jgi:protein phosphatase
MIGTTLVLALTRRGLVLVAHLGDSRAYLCRGGMLRALTRDHSFAQEMIDRRELEAETAELRRWNGGPTRFVGMPHTPAADVRVLPWASGDRLLLCSDGLTGELNDETIRAVLCEPWPPERTCKELLDRANAAGGHDNITAAVLWARPRAGSGA